MMAESRTFGQILSDARVRPKKRLGQHFITDPRLLSIIASAMVPDRSYVAVEIGAGIGTLTGQLCSRAGHVYAIEKDTDLGQAAAVSIDGLDNLTWIWGDALEYDLTGKTIRERHPQSRLVLCGNLPYYLTSLLLYSALVNRPYWSRLGFLVQTELAERMTATPSGGQFGRLSLWCQYRTELTVERRVPRGAFMPRPEVESSLVTMSVLPAFELSEREESFMDLLSRALFTKRRKTILNGLSSLYPQKERLAQAIRTSGLNPSARPEELGVSGFLTLTRGLSSLGEPRPLSLPR